MNRSLTCYLVQTTSNVYDRTSKRTIVIKPCMYGSDTHFKMNAYSTWTRNCVIEMVMQTSSPGEHTG